MSVSVIRARIKMIEIGIAPALTGCELSRMLESMDPEDRKKANRKFRKLWRKIEKKESSTRGYLMNSTELSDSLKKRNRCVIVAKSIIDNCY